MYDFLEMAERLLVTGALSGEEEKHFRRVFRAKGKLQAVHSKARLDFENIERLFAAFEMATVIGRFPGLREDVEFEGITASDLVDSLKRLIVATLERSIGFARDHEGRSHGAVGISRFQKLPILPTTSYDRFKDLLYDLQHRNPLPWTSSVITFNYDIALDYALYNSSTDTRDEDWKTYSLFGSSVDYGLGGANGGFPLLKLHGSLNWGYCPDCKNVVAVPAKDWSYPHPMIIKDIYHLRVGGKLAGFEHDCGACLEDEPVIVPPTWSKSSHHHRLTKVWSRAAEELSEARQIVVIGYSLPESDAFFRFLYALGTVGDHALQKFLVYDPAVENVEGRFADLLGPGITLADRFECVESDFANAITDLRERFGIKEVTPWVV